MLHANANQQKARSSALDHVPKGDLAAGRVGHSTSGAALGTAGAIVRPDRILRGSKAINGDD